LQAHDASLALGAAGLDDDDGQIDSRLRLVNDALRAGISQGLIHLTAAGYRAYAQFLEEKLIGTPGAWRTSAQAETLRQAILQKNEWARQ